MSASHTNSWETAIAGVTEDDVIVRGARLSQLIGELTFSEMMFFVLTGRYASKGQSRVLDGLLVSLMEHGISPSTLVARLLASYGGPIQSGIAAGVLTFGDYHGGACEQLAATLEATVQHSTVDGEVSEERLQQAAKELVAESRARRSPVDGFGHPQHGADPRSPILLQIARDEGVFSHHCSLLTHLEVELAEAVGRPVPANMDGVTAALTLDLGFKWEISRLLLITPRTVGLAAHYCEETNQGNRWRHVPDSQVTYRHPGDSSTASSPV